MCDGGFNPSAESDRHKSVRDSVRSIAVQLLHLLHLQPAHLLITITPSSVVSTSIVAPLCVCTS
jgi:hypothetical protein